MENLGATPSDAGQCERAETLTLAPVGTPTRPSRRRGPPPVRPDVEVQTRKSESASDFPCALQPARTSAAPAAMLAATLASVSRTCGSAGRFASITHACACRAFVVTNGLGEPVHACVEGRRSPGNRAGDAGSRAAW
jgi:hypothetical protein